MRPRALSLAGIHNNFIDFEGRFLFVSNRRVLFLVRVAYLFFTFWLLSAQILKVLEEPPAQSMKFKSLWNIVSRKADFLRISGVSFDGRFILFGEQLEFIFLMINVVSLSWTLIQYVTWIQKGALDLFGLHEAAIYTIMQIGVIWLLNLDVHGFWVNNEEPWIALFGMFGSLFKIYALFKVQCWCFRHGLLGFGSRNILLLGFRWNI